MIALGVIISLLLSLVCEMNICGSKYVEYMKHGHMDMCVPVYLHVGYMNVSPTPKESYGG